MSAAHRVPTPTIASSAQIAVGAERAIDGAPYALTASDGSGLQLAKLDARAVFEGPLAYTELHLYFHNGEARTREGTFQITLPPGAAVSRFAMETNGQMQEAEVVDKKTARRAYDDALHRRQDPALLEKAPGNEFTAKVFPIAGNADKHIVISFSQELPGKPYALPLRGLPTTAQVDVALDVVAADGERTHQTLSRRDWKPDADFVSTAQTSPVAVGAGPLIAAQVGVVDDGGARQAPTALTILVDTSASRALGFAAYLAHVRALIAAVGKDYGGALPVRVVAFDQDTQEIYRGPADGYSAQAEAAFVARGAAGASDLAQALAAAPDPRVLVVTDGVLTAGASGGELDTVIQNATLVQRIDVALTGGIRDDAAATAIVRAAHGAVRPRAAGAVFDLDADGAAGVSRELADPVQLDVAVDIPGAEWVYPRVLPSARAGQRTMVYARMGAAAGEGVQIRIGGQAQDFGVVAVESALLERAVAGAEIAQREALLAAATDPKAAADLRADIAKRSIAARVVSSQTSMLVLETDDDYARYGIDRTALSTILTIGPKGVERTSRQTWIGATPTKPRRVQQQIATSGAAPDQKPAQTEELAKSERAREQAIAATSAVRTAEKQKADDGDDSGATGTAMALDEDKVGRLSDRNETADANKADDAYKNNDRTREGDAVAAEPADIQELRNGQSVGAGMGRGQGQVFRGGSYATAGSSAAAPVTPAVIATPPPAMRPPAPEPTPRALHERGPTGRISVADPIETMPVPRDADRDADGIPDAADAEPRDAWPPTDAPSALEGPLAGIEAALHKGDRDRALADARAWHDREPGNVLALIGLGDALEAKHDTQAAARIYGSIIDLFPSRADMRRFAGERLARLGTANHASDGRGSPAASSAAGWQRGVMELQVDTYKRAAADRPDHINGHRLLAYALLRDGKIADAFAAILVGVDTPITPGRYLGADRVLREDAGMIAAAYIAADPSVKTHVMDELGKRHIAVATRPSTRFILYWETDANDVDFHIQDARGGHAYYAHPNLASGGNLYADITTGYGPECFAIEGAPTAGPYRLSINYFSQGPMGYGMGLLEVQRFDGKGGLTFEDRPYEIMHDQAFVDLGTFDPKAALGT